MDNCFFLDIRAETKNEDFALDVFLCLTHLFFGVTAVCSNAVILRTISCTPSLKSPSNTLLFCLALSDLMVGLLVQPSFIPYRIFLHSGATREACISGVVFETSGWFLSAVTFFTLFAISFERYIAISLPLRYQHIITVRRVSRAFAVIVFFSAAIASCRVYVLNNTILRTINAVLIPGNFATLCFIYCKIFLLVKTKHKESHRLGNAGLSSHENASAVLALQELVRFTKSTLTMVYIGGVFFLCYIPFFCTMIAYLIYGDTKPVSMAYYITLTILFLCSSINPFLYCYRITPIRRAMKKTIAQLASNLNICHA